MVNRRTKANVPIILEGSYLMIITDNITFGEKDIEVRMQIIRKYMFAAL